MDLGTALKLIGKADYIEVGDPDAPGYIFVVDTNGPIAKKRNNRATVDLDKVEIDP